MNNQLELHEQHTVLITGGGVDDDDLIDVVERDGGGVFLSAFISRSDGAIAVITEAKRLTYHPDDDNSSMEAWSNWLYGSFKTALPWTADEAEADENEEDEDEDEEDEDGEETIELDRAAGFRRRRTFSFHLRLEKIEGLTPSTTYGRRARCARIMTS